jgi:hypothetical protein
MLEALANVHPLRECGRLAEPGIVGLVLVLYQHIWSLAPDVLDVSTARKLSDQGAALVHTLLRSGNVAADDLQRVICSRDIAPLFTGLLVLQVRLT